MVCQYCGKEGEDVYERPDGYRRDVGNEPDAEHIACNECDEANTDAI